MKCRHYFECCQCSKCDCCCLKRQEEFIGLRVYMDAFKKDCFCVMKCKHCDNGCSDCDRGFIGCCLLCRGCIC